MWDLIFKLDWTLYKIKGTENSEFCSYIWRKKTGIWYNSGFFSLPFFFLSNYTKDFPHSSAEKESAFSAGDRGSTPGLGISPGEGIGNPLQYSCLENPMDRGAWTEATVHGVVRVGHNLATKPLPPRFLKSMLISQQAWSFDLLFVKRNIKYVTFLGIKMKLKRMNKMNFKPHDADNEKEDDDNSNDNS